MTVQGWQPNLCGTCGHAEGDHRTGGQSWPHPPAFGICLVSGCACREFVAAEEPDRAAA